MWHQTAAKQLNHFKRSPMEDGICPMPLAAWLTTQCKHTPSEHSCLAPLLKPDLCSASYSCLTTDNIVRGACAKLAVLPTALQSGNAIAVANAERSSSQLLFEARRIRTALALALAVYKMRQLSV